MKDEYAFPDILGEEIELKPKASSKYRNYWERFKNLIRRVNMKDVSGSLHFRGSSDASWQAFKETFNVTDISETYSCDEMYESGDTNVYGIYLNVYGPHRKNPNYVPPSPQEIAETESERLKHVFMNYEVFESMWELIVKGLIEVDDNLMKAALDGKSMGRDWDYMLAKAKIHYSEVKE